MNRYRNPNRHRRTRGDTGFASQRAAAGARLWAVAWALLTASACAVDRFQPVTEPVLAAHIWPVPVVAGPIDIETGAVIKADLPFNPTDRPQILIGDVHGLPQANIVVTAADGVAIYTIDGQLVATHLAYRPVYGGAVLADSDADGKLDVIIGVMGESDPIVRVVNGNGQLTTQQRFAIARQVPGSIRPFSADGSTVYAVVGESWVGGFRGIVALNAHDLSSRWFFALPTGIAGAVRVDDRIHASTYTQHNGEFLAFGRLHAEQLLDDRGLMFLPKQPGFDAVAQWLVTATDGSLIEHRTLFFDSALPEIQAWAIGIAGTAAPAHGITHLVAESDQQYRGWVHYSAGSAVVGGASGAAAQSVDGADTAIASLHPLQPWADDALLATAAIIVVRLADAGPTGPAGYRITVETANGQPILEYQRVTAIGQEAANPPLPLAVVAQAADRGAAAAGRSYQLLLVDGSDLRLVPLRPRAPRQQPQDILATDHHQPAAIGVFADLPRRVVVSQSNRQLLVVTVGEHLSILRLNR